MKILFTSLIAFFLHINCLPAQQVKSNDQLPLIIIDKFETNSNSLVIGESKISSIRVLKLEKAKRIYGQKGENGVILVNTKEKINFLRLSTLLDKFEFPDSLRKFRVCINEVIVDNPGLILVDPGEVEGVSTFNITDWKIIEFPKTEKFINIMSKKKDHNRLVSSF